MNDYVSLAVAQKLAEEGFPQNTSSAWWFRATPTFLSEHPNVAPDWTLSTGNPGGPAYERLAAPTHLAVLDWLQKRLGDGYRITIDIYHSRVDCTYISSTWVFQPCGYEDGILAILAHMKERAEV
ncbi:MAG: hypothetical protein Q7K41_00665 [Dehalococcoidales bacterium]|nr:hypothetical protein [Dehalococcoidales bacterium]